jgi:hypothetical protein
VRINAAQNEGSLTVWGGLFSTFDCTFVYLRQKDDPWNSIGAGAVTGGFLSLRAGMKFGSRSAICDGVLLALIEGAGIMLDRVNRGSDEKPSVELQQDLHQLQLLPPHFPLHFKELQKSRHRRRSISANPNRAPTLSSPRSYQYGLPPPLALLQTLLQTMSSVNCASWGCSFLSVCKTGMPRCEAFHQEAAAAIAATSNLIPKKLYYLSKPGILDLSI